MAVTICGTAALQQGSVTKREQLIGSVFHDAVRLFIISLDLFLKLRFVCERLPA